MPINDHRFWRSKHHLFYHRLRIPWLTPDVIPFFRAFNIPFESNASIKPDENILTHNKENSIHNIVRVLMFQQLLANKHHKLCDSKFGWSNAWWGSVSETGNGERRTENGNGERGTGNEERETKNGKRRTGNEEQGTGKGERESRNECTAVTRLIIQNGRQRKRKGSKRNNLGKCEEVFRL